METTDKEKFLAGTHVLCAIFTCGRLHVIGWSKGRCVTRGKDSWSPSPWFDDLWNFFGEDGASHYDLVKVEGGTLNV